MQPGDVFGYARATRPSADYKINQAVPTLFSLLGVSAMAVTITLLLPPVPRRPPSEPGVRRFLAYPVPGRGYLGAWIDPETGAFLGHPTYA